MSLGRRLLIMRARMAWEVDSITDPTSPANTSATTNTTKASVQLVLSKSCLKLSLRLLLPQLWGRGELLQCATFTAFQSVYKIVFCDRNMGRAAQNRAFYSRTWGRGGDFTAMDIL